MVALIVTGVFTLLLGAGIIWLSIVFLRKIGIKTPRATRPAARRLLWLSVGAGLVIAAFEAWAFGTQHAALGVAVLVAFSVLPEFVLVPLHLRRSRDAAELSRARRARSDQDST